MAKNTGKGWRRGAVNNRSQVLNPSSGQYVKRDGTTGRFINVKQDGRPHKGIRNEKDS